MRLYLASTNPSKQSEFTTLLKPWGVEIASPPLPWPAPPEDGATFAENALQKAQALRACNVQPVLADDSGLEVDALQGAPGIHSARYAAASGSADEVDAANRRCLLEALRAQGATLCRAARFVCVLAYVEAAQPPRLFCGEVRGHIALQEAGHGGFGYDAVFVPEGYTHTLAQLPAAVKHTLSHRAQAVRALAAYLHPSSAPPEPRV